MNRFTASLVLSTLAMAPTIAAGCSTSSGTNATPSPDAAATTLSDGLAATCSPLRTPGACMMPFPNAIYTEVDPTTKTGVHVSIPSETLPVPAATTSAVDTTRFNRADGFSPSTPILAYFDERIDVASLVPPQDPSSSLTGKSATVLVDMTAGNKLVAHFSEVDMTIRQDFHRQALMIRPLARLTPNHRYAVAITTAVKTIGGALPTAPPQFAAIADGHAASDAMSQKEAVRMPDILAALAATGVARKDLVVAWDFVTGTDEYLTSHLLSMRDAAFQEIGVAGGNFTITKMEDNPSMYVARRIVGTFTVPQFISPADPTNPQAEMEVDAQNHPVMKGHYEAPFTMIIPKSALTTPAALLLSGHGLLGTAEGTLSADSGLAQAAVAHNTIMFATDWIGTSANENPAGGKNGALAYAVTDMNHLPWVTNRMQQGILNAMVLTRIVRDKMAKDPVMTIGGKATADPTRVFYWGISDAGIHGTALMGYSPDITQAVLGVPGGPWSLMIQRSSEWPAFALVMQGAYPDYLDKQLFLALSQMDFDYGDPTTAAPHVVIDPLPGTTKKQMLLQMAVNDSLVPNLSTEELARTMGIALIGPPAIDVYGMVPVTDPQPSGLSLWDIHPMPPVPLTNETPTSSNGAHDQIHSLVNLQAQIETFFKTGQVVNTCAGPCNNEK